MNTKIIKSSAKKPKTKADTQAITHRVEQSSMDMAARVGQLVDMYEIRLVHHWSRAELSTTELPPLRMDSRKCKVTRDATADKVRIDSSFIFALAYDSDESRAEPPVAIHATFALTYVIKELDSFSDNELEAFGKVNGFYNAWPFWREFVYSMMSRMGLPPISLPVFRVIEEKREAQR